MIYHPMQLKHKIHEPHIVSNPRGTQLKFGNLQHEGKMLF